jgi:hypothetical protein
MAKNTTGNKQTSKPAEGETLTGYFRRIFRENRKLLKTRSNEEVLQRWQADHPGEEITGKVKMAVGNAKGSLRQKLRKRKASRAQAEQPQQMARAGNHEFLQPKHLPRGLEHLEERIDDRLSMAKGIDWEGLVDVIKLLHRARNEVVWKMGL